MKKLQIQHCVALMKKTLETPSKRMQSCKASEQLLCHNPGLPIYLRESIVKCKNHVILLPNENKKIFYWTSQWYYL